MEKSFNYNLICEVKRKVRPLNLNVKGIGYFLHHDVFLDKKEHTRLNHSEVTLIDFGKIYVHEKKTHKIIIANNGDFNFDFIAKKQDQF